MDEDLLLLIISSPSGAGKTTLTRDLLERHPALAFSVSHTTRKPRDGEVSGRDYHFVDRATFDSLVERKAFAEWAEVHGNRYGTALSEIERCRDEGKRGIVFDIDYQGAAQIKAARSDAVGVFVLPPSMGELKERLQRRASDDADTIERRFKNAKREIEHYGEFDYVIVNDDLEQAKARLNAIVLAEQSRRERMAGRAKDLLQASRDD
ncbi:MAG: guanylate kinase [Myxococcales bacterium]|nr:guanylate kinase [Myxococcales bacterium]